VSYKALALGPMSVVAPISSAAALVPVSASGVGVALNRTTSVSVLLAAIVLMRPRLVGAHA
jgi:hypothetical protein